ncbi:MAG: hypothetical protein UX68_C0018G0009 [Parcubacteria group bacterium GW2011_GWA2_46_9]|nr:MAG: hypothetical protein UX68_C0018G0009 [Parcubacteria group bacterium GW2011_GWA2_46_9]
MKLKLTWLPNWRAYSVRREGDEEPIGMVLLKGLLPFRANVAVEFV